MAEFNYRKVFSGGDKINDSLENTIVHNCTVNRDRLMGRLEIKDILSLDDMPKTFRPAIVCGSGPSLDELPKYANLNPVVFASASHYATVEHHLGRAPDFTVAVDCREALGKRLREQLEGSEHGVGGVLITHPGIAPGIFDVWDGPICLFRPINPASYFKKNVLPLMYSSKELIQNGEAVYTPKLLTGVFDSGCVVNIAVSLAAYMGYNPILLLGADYSFNDEQGSGAMWLYSKVTQGWFNMGCRNPSCFGQIEHFRGKVTSKEMEIYMLNLVILWQILGVELYNLSSLSILKEIPLWKANIKKLFRDRKKPNYPIKNVQEHAKNVLANEYGVELVMGSEGYAQLVPVGSQVKPDMSSQPKPTNNKPVSSASASGAA